MANESARAGVETWLCDRVGEMARVPVERIASDSPVADVGLSSVQAGELTARIEDAYGIHVGPTFVFDHPTPAAMAEEIIDRTTVRL